MNEQIPFPLAAVQAGFASAADEFVERSLDLNELVIKHEAATFFVRVVGDSMQDAGIHSGDIVAVDRAVSPTSGRIVIAVVDGEFTIKKLQMDDTGIYLCPANTRYKTVKIDPESDFRIWGVVTYVIGPR